MPRITIDSHKRRDKVGTTVDSRVRAPAQIIDFLSQQARQVPMVRKLFIESILWKWAKRNGHKGDAYDVEALAAFLQKKATAKKKTRPHLVEEIMVAWALKNGFKPKD